MIKLRRVVSCSVMSIFVVRPFVRSSFGSVRTFSLSFLVISLLFLLSYHLVSPPLLLFLSSSLLLSYPFSSPLLSSPLLLFLPSSLLLSSPTLSPLPSSPLLSYSFSPLLFSSSLLLFLPSSPLLSYSFSPLCILLVFLRSFLRSHYFLSSFIPSSTPPLPQLQSYNGALSSNHFISISFCFILSLRFCFESACYFYVSHFCCHILFLFAFFSLPIFGFRHYEFHHIH